MQLDTGFASWHRDAYQREVRASDRDFPAIEHRVPAWIVEFAHDQPRGAERLDVDGAQGVASTVHAVLAAPLEVDRAATSLGRFERIERSFDQCGLLWVEGSTIRQTATRCSASRFTLIE